MQSVMKVEEFQRQEKLTQLEEAPSGENLNLVIKQEPGLAPPATARVKRAGVYIDMGDFHGDDEPLGDPIKRSLDYDAVQTKMQSIVSEYENYLEDRAVVDQQTIRLPDDTVGGTSPIFVMTLFVRKIKSNIENILQILWEREVNAAK